MLCNEDLKRLKNQKKSTGGIIYEQRIFHLERSFEVSTVQELQEQIPGRYMTPVPQKETGETNSPVVLTRLGINHFSCLAGKW